MENSINLKEKTLVISHQFAKFTNVSSCQHFPLYGITAFYSVLQGILQKLMIPYSEKILWTINFAVFEDFTTASKINSSKYYYSIESYDSLVDP